MIVEKVYLENFISHRSTRVELGPGVIVIVGPNGAGKTSILDAISYALFGEHSRGKDENIVNRSAIRAQARVEVLCSGRRYIVERSYSKAGPRKSDARLYAISDGRPVLIARGVSAVQKEVEKILGMNKKVFLSSVFVRQGEIERLVMARPKERKEIIASLIGVSDLEKAWQAMGDIIREWERLRLAPLEQKVASERDVRARIARLKQQLREVQGGIKVKEEEVRELERKVAELEAALRALEEKSREHAKLQERLRLVEEQIEEVHARLEEVERKAREAEEAQKRIEELKKEADKVPLLQKLIMARSLRETLSRELEGLKARLNEAQKALRELQEHEKDYHELRKVEEELERLEARLSEARQAIGEAREAERQAALLEAKLRSMKQQLEARIKEIKAKGLENPEPYIDAADELLEEAEARLEEVREQLRKVRENLGALRERREQIRSQMERIKKLGDKCPLCGSKLTPEHKEKVLSQLRAEQLDVTAELEELEEKAKSLAGEEEKLRRAIDVLRVAVEAKRIKEQVEELEAELEEAKRRAETLAQRAKDAEEIARRADELRELRRALSEKASRYEAARRLLESLPPIEELQRKLREAEAELELVLVDERDVLGKLGYEPSSPEEELRRAEMARAELEKLSSLIAEAEAALREKQSLLQRLASLESEKKEVQRLLESLGYDPVHHEEVRAEHDEVSRRLEEARSALAALKEKLKLLESEIKAEEEKLKEIEEAKKQVSELRAFISFLEKIRKLYHRDGLQRILRARARPVIEAYTKLFLDKFNLEYTDLKIDEDYNITVIGPSGEQPVEAISGGERVALALALRLGIAKAIGGRIESLILDEPTVHLDEQRRRELVSILKSAFAGGRSVVPQIIIVTHDRELEDAADVVYEVVKEGGYSKVRAVSQDQLATTT